MSSSFDRVISRIATKLPRKEDKELLDKLAKTYEKGGAEAVKDALEKMIESIESE
jgi:predicted DNA-binding protein